MAKGLGIDLERGRPGHSQDNGAHERLHRELSVELECLGQDVSQDALDLWRHEFNYQRPHEALGMRTPAEVYQNSSRKYARSPQELIYPGMATRNVNSRGQIRWQAQEFFITTSLAGWTVGLKKHRPRAPRSLVFARLLLGWIDPTTASFLRADLRP